MKRYIKSADGRLFDAKAEVEDILASHDEGAILSGPEIADVAGVLTLTYELSRGQLPPIERRMGLCLAEGAVQSDRIEEALAGEPVLLMNRETGERLLCRFSEGRGRKLDDPYLDVEYDPEGRSISKREAEDMVKEGFEAVACVMAADSIRFAAKMDAKGSWKAIRR